MNAVTAVALAISLSQASGAAEEAAPAPGQAKLSFAEALRIANERNLDLKAANAQLRQADELSWQAWSYYLPQVTATGTYLVNQRKAELDFVYITDRTTTPFSVDSTRVTVLPKTQLTGQVDASQVLFSPSLYFAIQGANRGEDVARASVEGARRSIRFGVAQAFYGVAALAKAVSVNERLLEIAQRQERDGRVRFQAGTIAKVGLLRVEIDRARAEQDLKRARNAYESARLALATLLDRPADFEVAEPPAPAAAGDPARLEERALAERSDVVAARAAVGAARSGRNGDIAHYLPDVAAFGRYTRSDSGGLTGQSEAWLGGLSLTWTILDGGLRESRIRQGNARIDEAEARLRKAEADGRKEVRQALLDLDSARANAAKAGEQRELAAENQRLLDVSYKAGAATAVEQADATAALRTAEFALQAEELAAQLAALRVLQAAGVASPDAR
jgi:outer membrane protein TolC